MKKLLHLIIIVPFLTNCSSFNSGNIAPGYIDTFKAINNAVFGYTQDSISTELVNNIPYASMLLKIGKGPEGLMILEQNKRRICLDKCRWYIFHYKNGRIVRQRSLNDLTKVDYEGKFRDIFKTLVSGKIKMYYSFDKPC